MSLLNQGPSTSEPNYKDVSIDVPKIARSANRKNTAIIEIMEKFKKMGVITDMKETGKDSYRVSFKNLE